MDRAIVHRGILHALATTLLALCGWGVSSGLAPEPDIVSRRWQLAVEPGPLRVTMVDSSRNGAHAYLYFTYKVTNQSSGDLLFAPSFDLVCDDAHVVRAGRDVPADVTREILASLNNPSLQDQIGIVGTLLPGEENAKEGLVIWPAPTLHSGEVSVFAAGFSGETKYVRVVDPKSGKESNAAVRKTLMLRYQPSGELRDMSAKPIDLVESRWIMR